MTGSNNTKPNQKQRLAKMVQVIVAKRKLKAMGIVIVGVSGEEIVEFYKWIMSKRSEQ